MEDLLKCQINPLVKYRQNQTKHLLQTQSIPLNHEDTITFLLRLLDILIH